MPIEGTEIIEMTLEEIIDVAVGRAIAAQRLTDEKRAGNAHKATEQRLFAYPVLKLKIDSDREQIIDIQRHGAPQKSKIIIKLRKTSPRLTHDEIAEVLIDNIEADIAGSEHEIETINKALAIIADDKYADLIRHRYFEGIIDTEIAAMYSCDPKTVSLNRNRLVDRIAVFLYGEAAINIKNSEM